MKVSICKEVTVEAEVDVDLADILQEFSEVVADASEDGKVRRLVGWIDMMTQTMKRITPECIEKMKIEHRVEIHKRLIDLAGRFRGRDF